MNQINYSVRLLVAAPMIQKSYRLRRAGKSTLRLHFTFADLPTIRHLDRLAGLSTALPEPLR